MRGEKLCQVLGRGLGGVCLGTVIPWGLSPGVLPNPVGLGKPTQPPGEASGLWEAPQITDAVPTTRPNRMASDIFGPTKEPQNAPKRTNPPGTGHCVSSVLGSLTHSLPSGLDQASKGLIVVVIRPAGLGAASTLCYCFLSFPFMGVSRAQLQACLCLFILSTLVTSAL